MTISILEIVQNGKNNKVAEIDIDLRWNFGKQFETAITEEMNPTKTSKGIVIKELKY